MDDALRTALAAKKLPALAKVLATRPDLTALDRAGDAALHLVIRNTKLDLAQALVDAGSPVDVPNDDGDSPLYVLLKSKRGVMNDTEKANARWLLDRGARLDFVGSFQQTALHYAARSADVAFVGELVERGAKVTRDKRGATPLTRCFSVHNKTKDNPMWAFLLEHGCAIDDVDNDKTTLLHTAVTCHDVAGTKFLLARGIDRTARDSQGKTALDLAIEYRNTAIQALLA